MNFLQNNWGWWCRTQWICPKNTGNIGKNYIYGIPYSCLQRYWIFINV